MANITQRDDFRCNNFGEGGGFRMIRTFVPKIAQLAYGSATASAYVEPKPYQWVSMGTLATSDAQHYGLKVLIEDQNETGSTANNGYIRFLVRSWFEVKHGQ